MKFIELGKEKGNSTQAADVIKKTNLEINYFIIFFWLKDVHCE
jgi:hypothetical protein